MADQHTILFGCTLLPAPGLLGDIIPADGTQNVFLPSTGSNVKVHALKMLPEKVTGTVDEIVAAFRARLEKFLEVQEELAGNVPLAIFGGGEKPIQMTLRMPDLRPRT